MSAIVLSLRRRRLRWHTSLVLVSIAVVAAALLLADVLPVLTTIAAVAGGTGFVLGVSASISAFLERDSYADSDFWR